MQPLRTFKPPPVNEDTERLFRNVTLALNEIDRRLYPPVEILDERHDQLVKEYQGVAMRFTADAASCGADDWLQYSVTSRILTAIVHDETQLDRARDLFHQLECIGHPDVNLLISTKMIWANALSEANHVDEAQAVARELVADVDACRLLHPHALRTSFENEMADFCKRHGI